MRKASLPLVISTVFLLYGWESSLHGGSILDIQPLKSAEALDLPQGQGAKSALTATLVDLNPKLSRWYLLTFKQGGKTLSEYHLELLDSSVKLGLRPSGLVLLGGEAEKKCFDFSPQPDAALKKDSSVSYLDLCEGKLFRRITQSGKKSALEWMTGFLRQNVGGGDEIVNTVKTYVYQDKFLLSPEKSEASPTSFQPSQKPYAPKSARVDPAKASSTLLPQELGLAIQGRTDQALQVGTWYESAIRSDIYISLIEPQFIDPSIFAGDKAKVRSLDSTEEKALSYLVAFDLEKYRLAFEMGTEHPGVEWSARAVDSVKDKKKAGPDGFAQVAPLVMTGKINPVDAPRTAAVFTGGFKRSHGAFRWGNLALKNSGSHYGFGQAGVVLSQAQPGLATVLITASGELSLQTWQEGDDLAKLEWKDFRQNGVAIIDYNLSSQVSEPGFYVAKWDQGNWSGSVDSKQRTLRAGLCLQVQKETGKKFLIYGYFSSVTPGAMARIFQAYDCQYALHLDMNALEHTYLALIGEKFKPQHLIQGMSVVDTKSGSEVIPRFLGAADNRDFFYLTVK